MINLLPEQEKEEIRFIRDKKLTVVLGNTLLIALVSLILVLFSLKFYILEKLVAQETILSDVQKDYQDTEFLSLKDNMVKYNQYLTQINNFYKEGFYSSDALKDVSLIARPKGLYFTSIFIENGKEKNTFKVNITGFSDTRENLQALKDTLEGNLLWQSGNTLENVYFPPDVWIRSKDVNFALSFDVIKK